MSKGVHLYGFVLFVQKPITEGRRTELSIGLERWKRNF